MGTVVRGPCPAAMLQAARTKMLQEYHLERGWVTRYSRVTPYAGSRRVTLVRRRRRAPGRKGIMAHGGPRRPVRLQYCMRAYMVVGAVHGL